MKLTTTTIVTAALAFSTTFVGESDAQEAKKKSAPRPAPVLKTPLDVIAPADGDAVVFIGDSITHQCQYTQYVEDFFYTRYPDRKIRFHNAGVGGDKASDVLVRFDDDVAKFKPKFVTVLIGMNDGRYSPFKDDITGAYKRDMTILLDRLEKLGSKTFLITPTLFDYRAALMSRREGWPPQGDITYDGVLSYFGVFLREQAEQRGMGFVDMHGPLTKVTWNRRKKTPSFTMIGDAVHPAGDGQMVMASALIEDAHSMRIVSEISIRADAAKPALRFARNCSVDDLTATSTGVKFTVDAKSIPWTPADDAKEGFAYVSAGRRFSRESLKVARLPDATYRLMIDGVEVGEYSAETLDDGIALESNPATPQYKQSAEVAKLNKEKNEKFVRPLRDTWLGLRNANNQRAALRAKPGDGKTQIQLAELDKKIQEVTPRIDELIKGQRTLEDRIYETAKPKPRKYELIRKG